VNLKDRDYLKMHKCINNAIGCEGLFVIHLTADIILWQVLLNTAVNSELHTMQGIWETQWLAYEDHPIPSNEKIN